MGKDKKDLKSSLERLEKIAAELSRNDVDVEKGLEKFKEGVALIKSCRSQLKQAENEFIKLKEELEVEETEEN